MVRSEESSNPKPLTLYPLPLTATRCSQSRKARCGSYRLWSPTGKPVAPSGTPVGRNPEQEPPAKAGGLGPKGRGTLTLRLVELLLLAQAVEVELHLVLAVLVLEKFHLLLALQFANLLLLARLVLLALDLIDLQLVL